MRRRSGFTLVEVLVSMALILFIMSILAGAFGAASQAVSDLKAAGDMAEKLRAASNVIKHDLGQDHFTDSNQGSPRLSDPNFWDRLDTTKTPPPGPYGFFRIYQTGQATQEGVDLDTLPSFIQTNTSLHYTIAQHGTRRSDFLSAVVAGGSSLLQPSSGGGPYQNLDNFYQDPVPAGASGVFSSQFAEVELFLGLTGDSTDGSTGSGPLPLYALYRRQQLAVPKSWTQTTAISTSPAPGEAGFDYEMSMSNSKMPSGAIGLNFNTMQDLSMPGKRFNCTGNAAGTLPAPPMPPYPPIGNAADLLLNDVVSFDVRILAGSVNATTGVVTTDSDFRDIAASQIQSFNTGSNPAYPQGNAPYIFDTWSNLVDSGNPGNNNYTNWNTPGAATSIPVFQDANRNRIIIKAIQISLRVWDFKTKKTRQVTIVQQM
jgi:prepilin-type N-terminal cleavage/methylation domain-containing protein